MQTDRLFDPLGESPAILDFRRWLVANGASVHEYVRFKTVPSGYSVIAARPLEADSTIVTCPFTLAITPEQSKRALQNFLPDIPDVWNERQLMCTYMSFHRILDHPTLKHRPYLHVLPHPSKLRTPLHFTEQELEALKGSNLYGATLGRLREWQTEWNQCRDVIRLVNEGWALDFSWEHWKTVATYISSRAFPSTLLSPHPSLVATKASHPILLPGVDSLNHARAHPVSWVVYVPSESDAVPEASTISLVHHQPISAHSVEIFNNYGPKGNPELLLGYGFVIPDNPDDTIVLRVGGGSGGSEGKRWEVGREAKGIEGLWQEVLDIVSPPSPAENASDSDDDGETQPPQWSLHLDAAAALQSMVESSLDRLPAAIMEDVGLRPDVREMIRIYVKGQREILEGIARFAQEKEEAALNSAAEQGVEVVMED